MSEPKAHPGLATSSRAEGGIPLAFSVYEQITKETDQYDVKGIDGLPFILLGLFGETGSLLSELKKKKRDRDSYTGYRDSVVEELGDVLWYLSNAAHRAGIELSSIAEKAVAGLSKDEYRGIPCPNTFTDLQKACHSFKGPYVDDDLQEILFSFAQQVGIITASASRGPVSVPNELEDPLSEAFATIIAIADKAELSLNHIATFNRDKILSRWPLNEEWGSLFDDDFDADEQLPRMIKIVIKEKDMGGKKYVIQQCEGINIGNRLTDNRVEQDDYRFHDVFHRAYAAILGWSPVIRALFKVKRKSCPKIDENEDGARAILIEEGISTWCFNRGTKNKFFRGIDSLDYSLLKDVRTFVTGYEVECRPLWQWERAILEGFRVFRKLKKHRQGIVIADLNKHTIRFKRLQ